MKRIQIIALILVSTLLINCKTNQPKVTSKDGKFEYFGEPISENSPISVTDLVDELKKKDEYVGQIQGNVTSVCKVKGCWMNVVSEDGTSVFVKFKDYGFFMPMDLDGEQVIMRGKGFVEVTSVDELRHYAEDEGKTQEEIEKIVEPEEELKFLADGVILIKK